MECCKEEYIYPRRGLGEVTDIDRKVIEWTYKKVFVENLKYYGIGLPQSSIYHTYTPT